MDPFLPAIEQPRELVMKLAYAKKAQVALPPLEEYEQKILPFNPAKAASPAHNGHEQPAQPISA